MFTVYEALYSSNHKAFISQIYQIRSQANNLSIVEHNLVSGP